MFFGALELGVIKEGFPEEPEIVKHQITYAKRSLAAKN